MGAIPSSLQTSTFCEMTAHVGWLAGSISPISFFPNSNFKIYPAFQGTGQLPI